MAVSYTHLDVYKRQGKYYLSNLTALENKTCENTTNIEF